MEPKYRGMLVQNGACPLLVKYGLVLASENILISAHALAKILISTNPFLAFKNESAAEVVRPLVILLTASKSGLEQFEAMLALTNLAGMDDSVRLRIIQLNALTVIENLQFSDHTLLRRASTELICNLIYHPIVFEKYLNPKSGPGLQILVALSDDEDEGTRRAASGAVAVLSSEAKGIKLILGQKRIFEILISLMESKNPELIHRASEIIRNIFQAGKDYASTLPIDILDLVDEFSNDENKSIAQCNQDSIKMAAKMNLLQI
jgi:hypothetical protein